MNYEPIKGFFLINAINPGTGQVLGPTYIRAGCVFSMTPILMPGPAGQQLATSLIAPSPVAGTGFNGIVMESPDMIAQLERNALAR
jgi:hypothetical protein